MNARISYLIDMSKKYLGEALFFIVKADAYLRQPCYSSRAQAQFYFIVSDNSGCDFVTSVSFIQDEFPEYAFNFLTQAELEGYPLHCRWGFKFAEIVYSKNADPLSIALSEEDIVQSLGQSIVGVGHIARLYYLRDLNAKTLTWAVRQFGWALRCAEYGIVMLWQYYISQCYGRVQPEKTNISEALVWLYDTNDNWLEAENRYMSDVAQYKQAALMLNDIVQYFSHALADKIQHTSNIIESNMNAFDANIFAFVASFRDSMLSCFQGNLKAFYLSGSAARGDQHKNSDIDSIAVFDTLDETVLKELRTCQLGYQNTSVYTLSYADLQVYPEFRYYTLASGTKKMAGTISLDTHIQQDTLKESCINNLYVILQVSRDYLIRHNAGPRSLKLLKLMAKLADHGVLRLIMQYTQGQYPEKKEAVYAYFKSSKLAEFIMQFLLNVNERHVDISRSVQQGDAKPLFNFYQHLNSFAENMLVAIKGKHVMVKDAHASC